MDKGLLTVSLLLLFNVAHPLTAKAQQKQKVTLLNALQLAAQNNLEIARAKVQHERAEEIHKEEKEQRIPDVGFHGSYGRMSDLTEYKSGLKTRQVTPMIPELADATFTATLPLYQGHRIRNSIKQAEEAADMTVITIEKKTNDIQIEVIADYLGIYKLMKVQQLLVANYREEEDRLKEVKAFKKHGTVTNNEVLRIELQLSNRALQLLSNKRSISIGLHQLKTRLHLPERDSLELDTVHLLQERKIANDYKYYQESSLHKDEMRLAQGKEHISLLEQDKVRGNYYPKINFFSSFGYNYPNYLFFPPNPNGYSLGKVGIEAVFSLSGLYKNKTKMAIAHQQLEEEQLNTALLSEAISNEVFSHYTRYQEVLDKIPVNQKAVRQATENYRIVRLKYKNQLALMTDMLDADNALLDAQFESISTQIDALMHYYELQYAAGLLQSK